MAEVAFRRIKGRIVPIKLSKEQTAERRKRRSAAIISGGIDGASIGGIGVVAKGNLARMREMESRIFQRRGHEKFYVNKLRNMRRKLKGVQYDVAKQNLKTLNPSIVNRRVFTHMRRAETVATKALFRRTWKGALIGAGIGAALSYGKERALEKSQY